MKKFFTALCLGILLIPAVFTSTTYAQTEPEIVITEEPIVFIFGRDDCGFCKELFAWIQEEDITYEYLNIVEDDQAKDWYNQVTEKHEASKVTPIVVIGERVITGFNGPDTTGQSIKLAIETARSSDINSIEDHIARASKQDVVMGGGCTGISCDLGEQTGYTFELPFPWYS